VATEASFFWFLLAVGLLLLTARILGELCVRLRQPAVIGEILAGVLLGPTMLGAMAPAASSLLFPASGASATMLASVVEVALILFLLVAGLEVNLASVWKQGRKVLAVASAGFAFPLAVGVAAALALPDLLQHEALGRPWISALIFGTALSITALPVVVRILQDLGLYRSPLGTVIVASAALDDVTGWIAFALLLAVVSGSGTAVLTIPVLVGKTVLFAALVLTLGRAIVHRALSLLAANTGAPAGPLGLLAALAILAAAASEWIGVHAIFGAFLVGVAASDAPHLRVDTREVLGQFTSSVLAPLFFASIGLRVNFLSNLNLAMLALVVALACLGKVAGCTVAGLLTGASRSEALAIGIGMNARGAMEIVLASLALGHGLIGEPLFVALVGMSLATSLMAGPLIGRVMEVHRPAG
jgi:Kef-type K+ transport system membrane component KefB